MILLFLGIFLIAFVCGMAYMSHYFNKYFNENPECITWKGRVYVLFTEPDIDDSDIDKSIQV